MVTKIETYMERDGREFGTEEEAKHHEAALDGERLNPSRRIQYSANNSGGTWWLSLEDWKALEEAGWLVQWFDWEEGRTEDLRFPGTPAWYAWAPVGLTEDQAREAFTNVTGKDSWEEGCNCCAPPHGFYERDAKDADEWVRYAGPNGWNVELEAADEAAKKAAQTQSPGRHQSGPRL